ncbi:hypothetical protein [Novilysobacter selenitireducens]|uniref:DUF1640 domain-containing protein n=1 Tax=Novilysobacter selenitireducens TaxID=2872639 RepID=A0ABS7T5E0_9GAMM|nr:hypothetical protein [Lysobacter selenitireducens]MBZ4039099.1 hypothetical protein [Lysobacter selenitireducens]
MFAKYLCEFPLFKRSVAISAFGSGSIAITGEAKFHVTRKPRTVEERLDYLQDQIAEVRQEISEEIKKMQVQIERVDKDAATGIADNARDIRSIRETLEKSATGGVKQQVFGVLLVLYGSIAAYVT